MSDQTVRQPAPVILDASRFGTHNNGREAPIYWGILGLCTVEATVFASLIGTYFYLELLHPEWPPAGVKEPELLLPTINTVLLLISSVFVHQADQGIRKGKQKRLRWGLGIGTLLALAFLVIKYIEYSHIEYKWSSHAYGSINWTIVGFHTAHVIALVLKTIVIQVLAFRGYFNEKRNIGVQVNGVYWHFVVLVWLPLYATLYLAPRFLD